MIGEGKSVRDSMSQLKMIVEGYHSVKCVYELNKDLNISMPITSCVYNILYKNADVKKEVNLLTKKLN